MSLMGGGILCQEKKEHRIAVFCIEERCGMMFREMRRKNQKLDMAECIAILRRGTSGVLALAGDNG